MNKRMAARTVVVAIGAGAVVLLALVSAANAVQFTTLLSFNDTNGASPQGSLTLSGSTLYGMTKLGGTGVTAGTVFSLPVTGGTPTTLSNFAWDTHGAQPYGNLTLSGSTLYGMTSESGTHSFGTVFSLPVTGGARTVLLSFDGTNGQYPLGSLTLSGSTLYGTTSYGGASYTGGSSGNGVVFSIPTTGGAPTTLFDFDATHGKWPGSSLTLSGSTLYGMTAQGGDSSHGTVFSIPVTGGTPTILYNLDWTHGALPSGGLTLSGDGSTLYGMTPHGGAYGWGTVFSVPVTGGTPTILFSFESESPDGAHPQGSLTLSGSTLYGMTAQGGTDNNGTIFSMNIDGTDFQTLLRFDGANGANPHGDLTLSGSTLYGMTSEGGDYGYGTVFRLDLTTIPEPTTITLLGMGALAVFGYARRRRMK